MCDYNNLQYVFMCVCLCAFLLLFLCVHRSFVCLCAGIAHLCFCLQNSFVCMSFCVSFNGCLFACVCVCQFAMGRWVWVSNLCVFVYIDKSSVCANVPLTIINLCICLCVCLFVSFYGCLCVSASTSLLFVFVSLSLR